MLLSIITINYKMPELTLRCMNTLVKQFRKEFDEGIFELIIIDNYSGDNSPQVLKKEISEKRYKNIKIVENVKNSGFSGGCNLGAEKSSGELFLFLNNDTEVTDQDIKEMANYLRDNQEIGILGGLLNNSDGSPQSSVGKFYNLFHVLLLLIGLQKFGLIDKNPRKVEKVDWVKGGFMMVKAAVFRELGGFDEKIFMYTEDMELCYRAKKQGFGIYFYPKAAVVHKEHGSASRSFAIVNIYKGILYFFKKHKSESEYKIVRLILFSKAIVAMGVGKITGNDYLISTYRKAIEF